MGPADGWGMDTTNDTITLTNGKTVELDADGYIEVKVEVGLNELIDADLEGFLDLVSEKATGTSLLMDVNYHLNRVVDKYTVELVVTGDPAECLEES